MDTHWMTGPGWAEPKPGEARVCARAASETGRKGEGGVRLGWVGEVTIGAMHHELFHKGREKPGGEGQGGKTSETKCRFQQLDSHWKPLT